MPKILIVEDTQDQLELLAKTFRRAGFDVYGAHDGGHAMDRVRDVRPDVILLDQMMPEVDGITFLTNLRRFPKWKNTPVLVITGLNDGRLRTRAANLGVDDFLVKGTFQLRELIDLVKLRVANAEKAKRPAAPAQPAAGPAAAVVSAPAVVPAAPSV
ncbi:MAG TPA: response regulator [Tepidisphaeraceae bacterium]|nr:response regulator [Tepidisphaeraceae bacterium]